MGTLRALPATLQDGLKLRPREKLGCICPLRCRPRDTVFCVYASASGRLQRPSCCGNKESWRPRAMERQKAFSSTAVGQAKRTNMRAGFENQEAVSLSCVFFFFVPLSFFHIFFLGASAANTVSEGREPPSKASEQ